MSKYLKFLILEEKEKTQVWGVYSLRHGDKLAVIKWYGPWRQYTMFPKPDTVWNRGCLDDIIEFIYLLMDGRKR